MTIRGENMNARGKKTKGWKLPQKMFYLFSFCLFLLYGKFAYLSLSPVVYGKNVSAFASTRNTVKKIVPASRGTIFDNKGEALAMNVTSYTLIAYLDESRTKDSKNPKHVVNVEETSLKLAEVLDASQESIKAILEKGIANKKYQVEFGNIGRGITELKKDEILLLNLPGISFTESFKRYYPSGNFASYVVGYAKGIEVEKEGEITNEIVGEMGIEATYDTLLKGEDGYLEYQQDRYGYKIAGTNEINNEAKNGYDIYLTIDSGVQRFIESEIETLQETYEPAFAILTVMDAKTGDILGASSTPSFDPNIRDVTTYENPFVTTSYEPGSTMKIYTYLCSLEKGNYDGNFLYDSGHVKIGDDTINDWNERGWGRITLDKGFEYSSNVGVVALIREYLSKEELKDCLKKYGFGSKTGIELAHENNGKINFNYEVEVMTAGFGQGIRTTVMQQLQAATLLANNGHSIKPHIVSKIVDSNTKEVIEERKIEKSEQLVKKSSVEKMKELMYNTINGTDSGTAGKAYSIENFDLIGKTGTAQIYEPGKGYLKGDNNYIFSSLILYPKENPEIIIYGAMKQPKYGKYAGLATAVKNLVKNVAKYRNIYEEEKEVTKINSFLLKSYVGSKVDIVLKNLENYHLETIVLGEGEQIIKQYPNSGMTLLEKDKLLLLTNGGKVKMPNIMGWSKKDVQSFVSLCPISLETEGNGYVREFNIAEGTLLEEGMTLKVVYQESGE